MRAGKLGRNQAQAQSPSNGTLQCNREQTVPKKDKKQKQKTKNKEKTKERLVQKPR